MIPGLSRGDVYDVDIPIAGVRPAVILTRTVAIPYLSSVTVAEVTGTIRGIPSEVLIEPSYDLRLEHESAINCDNLFTVRKERLLVREGRPVFRGRLDPGKLRELNQALRIALELD